MRKTYAIFLLISLICNAYLLSAYSEMKVGEIHRVIVKESKDGQQTFYGMSVSVVMQQLSGAELLYLAAEAKLLVGSELKDLRF